MVFRDRIARRVVTAVALGGLLAVGQAGAASAHGARGDHDGYHKHGYSVKTTTDLTVYDRYACAKVWSYKGTPTGSVTFTLSGKSYDTETVYLRYGKACVGLSDLHPGWYKLTATYNGSGYFQSSYDSEYFKVRGYGYYKHDRYDPDHHYYKDSYDKSRYDNKDGYYHKDGNYNRDDKREWYGDRKDDPNKCYEHKDDSYSYKYDAKKSDWCKDGYHKDWHAAD